MASRRIIRKAAKALPKSGKCGPLAGSILATAKKARRKPKRTAGRKTAGRRVGAADSAAASNWLGPTGWAPDLGSSEIGCKRHWRVHQ